MLVYRDATRELSAPALRRELCDRSERCEANPAELLRSERSGLLAQLLLAAEVETALEDLDGATPASRALGRAFTDAAADAWWAGARWDHADWSRRLACFDLPETLVLKRAEGYAYYALDPATYGLAARELAVGREGALVLGVRSIGTSLGAVVLASLRERGTRAERLSVRPRGHAWDRECLLDAPALQLLERFRGAELLVVDEGPGLSGSTFLSVGEALERAGVPPERITFLVSHAPDLSRLLARDAARRWRRFGQHVVPGDIPFPEARDLGAGRWRELVYASEAEWPSSWASAERRKLRLPGSTDLIKFVGFPPYSDAPLARAECLADAGFCPPMESVRPGYARQRWCEGRVLRRPLGAADSPEVSVLERLVEYLAFRSESCRAPEATLLPLEEMARTNIREALGEEAPSCFALEAQRWVYADARLCPHEWVVSGGTLLKVDAIDHGDDHHFPGPCDAAWDVAGAIVEFDLPRATARVFLEQYRRRTGDAVAARMPPYLIAYAACRVGALQMAELSALGCERERLARDRQWYTDRLRRFLTEHRTRAGNA
jgi:hypothetical protein